MLHVRVPDSFEIFKVWKETNQDLTLKIENREYNAIWLQKWPKRFIWLLLQLKTQIETKLFCLFNNDLIATDKSGYVSAHLPTTLLSVCACSALIDLSPPLSPTPPNLPDLSRSTLLSVAFPFMPEIISWCIYNSCVNFPIHEGA